MSVHEHHCHAVVHAGCNTTSISSAVCGATGIAHTRASNNTTSDTPIECSQASVFLQELGTEIEIGEVLRHRLLGFCVGRGGGGGLLACRHAAWPGCGAYPPSRNANTSPSLCASSSDSSFSASLEPGEQQGHSEAGVIL
jgi:hypothetical protein